MQHVEVITRIPCLSKIPAKSWAEVDYRYSQDYLCDLGCKGVYIGYLVRSIINHCIELKTHVSLRDKVVKGQVFR